MTFGWQIAVRVSGVAIILIVVPLAFLVKRSPESMGLRPDGDIAEEAPAAAASGGPRPGSRGGVNGGRVRSQWAAPDNDFTAREAMRTPSYWMLVLAAGLRNTAHSGLSFLLAPVMVWFLQQGGREQIESLQIAAFFVGLVAFATVFFNPLIGWLGDRFPRQRLSALCMASGALALCLMFNTSGSLWILAAFSILQALSESANSLNWALMGEYFGRRSFATLRGWQHLPDQLVSMWTAVWMGLIFDATGSYYLALYPLIGILALSALTFLSLRRPRLPERLRARQAAESAARPE